MGHAITTFPIDFTDKIAYIIIAWQNQDFKYKTRKYTQKSSEQKVQSAQKKSNEKHNIKQKHGMPALALADAKSQVIETDTKCQDTVDNGKLTNNF